MELQKIIGRFGGCRVLVVGDLILDHYIWGKVNRISPEAPVPVVEVSKETFLLGGAANVAHNIVALGGKASVIGIRGKDMAGDVAVRLLSAKGVDCRGIVAGRRPTTVKTRVIAHHQQVVRFDREEKDYLESSLHARIVSRIKKEIGRSDAVIISDYRKGVISKDLVSEIVSIASRKGKFVAVDPKVGHFGFYRGASLITPNLSEAASGAGIEIRDEKSLLSAGRALMKKLKLGAVLITRGEEGMSLFQKKRVTHIPTVAKKVYDVTGAGDTVIAAFTLAQAAGASLEDAALIANQAAGLVVAEVGTAVASSRELIKAFQ